jgi:hypothetical protein
MVASPNTLQNTNLLKIDYRIAVAEMRSNYW